MIKYSNILVKQTTSSVVYYLSNFQASNIATLFVKQMWNVKSHSLQYYLHTLQSQVKHVLHAKKAANITYVEKNDFVIM